MLYDIYSLLINMYVLYCIYAVHLCIYDSYVKAVRVFEYIKNMKMLNQPIKTHYSI